MSLTGTVSQVLVMNRSLLDDWLYNRLMVQLLGTAGTVEANEKYKFSSQWSIILAQLGKAQFSFTTTVCQIIINHAGTEVL